MRLDAQRGKKLSQPTELRDVLPTFLDAAGAPIPRHLDGKSLLHLVRGNTKDWRPWIDLEHSMCYDQDHWTALTDGRFKYIYFAYDGREQLFDMAEDPGELHNLAEVPAQETLLKQWRRRMVDHLTERGEEFVANGKLAIRKKRLLYSPNYPKKT
jgi:arylsulfatase